MSMLIYCDFDMSLEDINQAIKNMTENSVLKVTDDNFINELKNCIDKTYKKDYHYKQCQRDQAIKMKEVSGEDDPKALCCTRVINYICMKKFLTSKCSVNNIEVERHDEQHFNYWNNITGHNECNGNPTESVIYCHNGNYYGTSN